MATGIDTPYRDPRTAYGRRIPVGEATELPGMPPEVQQPRAAAAAGGIDEQPPQRRGTVARGGLRTLAGPIGAAAAAAPEVLDVARVARAPGSTGIDVATQASEGIGRLASAGAGAVGGAKLGAVVAPFLGPLAPAAPLVGGIAGGAAGYFAADSAIRGGRELAGVDPRSPVERLAVPAAAAAPRRDAGGGRGFVNPPTIGDLPAPQPGPNTIIRDGNSYSGPADITEGAQIRRPNQALRNGGQLSVAGGGEEVAAIDARTRAINAASAQTQRALDAYGPGPQGGGVTGIGGGTLSSANNQRFDATPSASVLPAPGQSIGQFQALRAAEREGIRQRETTERGQDALLEGQLAATGAQRGIADLNSRTQREVANIGATARTTAAETNANARAAAAEAAARRFIPVAGGQQVVEIGGQPTTVTQPSRVFDIQGGRYVDPPAPQGAGGKPAQTQAPKAGEVRQGYRYMGGDPASPESWKKVA